MQMRLKLVLVVVGLLVGSPYLWASELQKFVGNYELAVGENAECPKKMDILLVAPSDNHLVVFGNSREPGYQRHYSKINSGKSVHPDDFGTESQTKSVFKKGVLKELYRYCEGLVFKRCWDWSVISSLTAVDPSYSQVVMSTPADALSFDAAGFPAGVDCKYVKTGSNRVTKILR